MWLIFPLFVLLYHFRKVSHGYMWSTLPLFALPFISGTSFIGMHLAYINQKPWWQWEGHSWALDTAAVRFGLLSQWAAVGLVCATVPHAASYFHFLKDSPRKYLRFWYLLLKYFLPWGGGERTSYFFKDGSGHEKIILCEQVDTIYTRGACGEHVMHIKQSSSILAM